MDATRIEDVVREFVQLKTRGVNLLGLCPFHPEKTPSFTVSPSKNLFKCFGCGKGGDAIAFLKEHEGFTYPEALRWLAARYHIEVEELEDKRAEDPEEQLKDQLYVVNQYARDYYVRQMWDTDEGKSIGLSYFKGRGFREAILRKYELGYAPPSGQSFSLQAVQQGFKPEILQKAGLVTQRNRDFFRDRVMFTIHSLSGKPVAFAGRVMGQSQGPKYINSPETPVYHKSNSLFGLYFARPSIIKQDECYLVEGYTDVLAL
ncbi:MAG: DNA primase, partial [Saprospiraceae bacterium]|nr:DNA primase [Saprospiraceae bacterium]